MNPEEIRQSIESKLEKLREFTATPGEGTTRFPFTKEARLASDYLASLMKEAGLCVRMDNCGAVIGRLEGKVKDTIMVGSHLDSVKNGGAYDGIAGAVCAIECAKLLKERNFDNYYSLEVIATNDEEGSRFKSGLFSGKAMFGQLSVEDIKSYVDCDGISVYEAMKEYGLDPDSIADNVCKNLKAFIEIHIEQGPVLEKEKKEIGIVDTIVGIQRLLITIKGRADHIGTMPMNMRMDALEAAAKVIANIGDRARTMPPAVATVGNLTVKPNIVNIVPDEVTFIVDYRGTTPQMIKAQHDGIMEDLEKYSELHCVTYSVQKTLDAQPVHMNEEFKKLIEESCIKNSYSHMHIVSGAGHDAQVFGERLPASMIFVPSINGRSHCPEEYTDERTLAQAVIVACDLIEDINRGRKI